MAGAWRFGAVCRRAEHILYHADLKIDQRNSRRMRHRRIRARAPPCYLDDGFEKKLYSAMRGAINYGDPDLEMSHVVSFFRVLMTVAIRMVHGVP